MAELDRIRAALEDRYSVEREIGKGATASVYLVQDLRHRRNLAVKVLRPELAASLGPDRFTREIEIAARLQHPNIVPLYESGQAGSLLYYSMPFVEGESLRDRLARDGRLPVDEALGIVGQVAEALAYAHDLGFVHRDIKPGNILLHHGQAVVGDFGIARAVSAASGLRLTTTGLVVGTPAYMSPEQATGDGEVDGRSDIYSLGCVLFECLAGRLPFGGSSLRAVVSQHVTAPVPRIRELRSEVPKHVEGAIVKALAKEPEDRFATVKEFSEVLRDPAALASASRTQRVGLYRIGAVAALAAIAGVGVVSWGSPPSAGGPAGGGLEGAEATSRVDSVTGEGGREATDGGLGLDTGRITASNEPVVLAPDRSREPGPAPSDGAADAVTDGAAEAASAVVDSLRLAMETARGLVPTIAEVGGGSELYDQAMSAEATGWMQLAAGSSDSAGVYFGRAGQLYARAATAIEEVREQADRARLAAAESRARVDSVGATPPEYADATALASRADTAYAASRFGAATDLYEQARDVYAAIPLDPHQATRQALMGVVQRYERSVESRDIEGLRAVFEPLDEEVWSGFFETARDIDVQVEIESLEPAPPSPTLDLRITTRYVDNRNRDQDQTNRFSWVFQQSSGRWVVSQIMPRNQNEGAS